jgi:hypothetical protein
MSNDYKGLLSVFRKIAVCNSKSMPFTSVFIFHADFVAQAKIFGEKELFRKCLMFRVLRQPVAYCRLADMFRLSFLHFVTC